MYKEIILFMSICLACMKPTASNNAVYDCQSRIYCHGKLLKTIQLSNLYENSKQFVNMKLKDSPEKILKEFEDIDEKEKDLEKKTDILTIFTDKYFMEDNLEPYQLQDFKEMPDVNEYIVDKIYQTFYRTINPMWHRLAVKTVREVGADPNRYSMIDLPHGFIKTGTSDSLPEPWQNYLIIRGLLSNEMFQTAKDIIKNLAHILKNQDFVPLTNRLYALRRTQLPLLALLVEDYLRVQADKPFLEEMLPLLQKEFEWWDNQGKTELKIGPNKEILHLYHYKHFGTEPRPEKFKEDYNLAQKLPSDDEKSKFFSTLRALEATAFNYLIRFEKNDENSETILNLDVESVIPVELNSVLQRYAALLASWHQQLNHEEETKRFKTKADEIEKAIEKVLWNEDRGVWLDWNLEKERHTDSYYATNLMPLFTLSYRNGFNPEKKIMQYLVNEEIINDRYGFNFLVVPTFLPLDKGSNIYGSILWNFFVIEGLRETNYDPAVKLGKEMADSLIQRMYEEYKTHETLFENYDAEKRLEEKNIPNIREESGSALGCVITLLRYYGDAARHSLSDTDTSSSASKDAGDEDEIKKSEIDSNADTSEGLKDTDELKENITDPKPATSEKKKAVIIPTSKPLPKKRKKNTNQDK